MPRHSAGPLRATLVTGIWNQTPLGGLKPKPGTRGRPRRDRCDSCKDLRGTTAAPGCPRLPLTRGAAPYESPHVLRDLYIEAPRLGRDVADLGRTYAERRAETGAHTSLNPRRRRGTINNRPNLKRRGGRGTCDSPELSRRPRPLLELELPRRRSRAVRRPPLEVPPPRVRRLRERLGPEGPRAPTPLRPLR